jgi:mRNA-degrading endonuclease RelE of RelBE toxin-antitoxin system
LIEWPNASNIKALFDREDYRLRVGSYRVIFTVHPNGEITVIRIEEVKKRDEHTY